MTYPHIDNKADYAEYEKAYIDGVKGYEIVMIGEEKGFSHVPCDICNRKLAGTRYECTLSNPNRQHRNAVASDLSVCFDCAYYSEYGRLDDMTMLELRQS